mgnify:FL=1
MTRLSNKEKIDNTEMIPAKDKPISKTINNMKVGDVEKFHISKSRSVKNRVYDYNIEHIEEGFLCKTCVERDKFIICVKREK